MPRNRSEKNLYSPALTAWFIALHKVRTLDENSFEQCEEEDRLFYMLTFDERELWGDMLFKDIDLITKQVYDAAQ